MCVLYLRAVEGCALVPYVCDYALAVCACACCLFCIVRAGPVNIPPQVLCCQLGARRGHQPRELRRMIRRSAATAAAACTSSSGFVRTLARGRGRGPRGAAGRRREPRHALPQPPQPPPAEASPAAEATWATPINASDKRWAWASLVFGGLAIGGLTLNKWEIEKRLEGYVKKTPERPRPIRPLARPSSARSSSGRPPASASLGQLADVLWLAGYSGPVFHT